MDFHHKTSLLPPLVLAVALAGCAAAATGPPAIIVDHSACTHCSMLISEPRFAAAYRVGDTDKVFDDIGCLLNELAAEQQGVPVQMWFRDVRDGSWIDADGATFLRAAALRTPMAGGIVATVHADEVERLQVSMDATVYRSLQEVRAAHAAAAHEPAVGRAQ